jgi:cobalt-zinc-cadmium efflux system membrane fusion protein
MITHRFVFTTLLSLVTLAGWSQERIALKPDDFQRLGIVFAPVKSGAGGAGSRFPATVINSPESVSTLSAPHAGVIESWLAAPGDRVRAGQALATLRSQEVLQLQQAWMTAVTTQESARFELEKSERLLAEGVVSTQRVNQARRVHEQAAFSQQAAAEPLGRVGFTADGLQAMRKAGEGLGRYRLLAPAAGTLTRRIGATGDVVAANAALVNLRTGRTHWIRLHVPARIVAGLEPGQKLKASQTGDELVLRHKDQSVEDSSQTVELLAEFTAENAHLPGQIISVELPPPPGGILVPGTAVVHSGDETSVFVRSADGVEARNVPLLPMGSDYLARSGLNEGEEVAVRGAAVLKGIKAGLGRIE